MTAGPSPEHEHRQRIALQVVRATLWVLLAATAVAVLSFVVSNPRPGADVQLRNVRYAVSLLIPLAAAIGLVVLAQGRAKAGEGSQRPAFGIGAKRLASLRGVKVLIAEDNEVNHLVARGLLRGAGIDVFVTNNGQQALELLRAEPGVQFVLMAYHVAADALARGSGDAVAAERRLLAEPVHAPARGVLHQGAFKNIRFGQDLAAFNTAALHELLQLGGRECPLLLLRRGQAAVRIVLAQPGLVSRADEGEAGFRQADEFALDRVIARTIPVTEHGRAALHRCNTGRGVIEPCVARRRRLSGARQHQEQSGCEAKHPTHGCHDRCGAAHWRRGRDSNPRGVIGPHTLSRRAT